MDGRSSSRKQESMADGVPDEVGSSKNVDPDDTDNVLPGFKDVNAFSKVDNCLTYLTQVDLIVVKLSDPLAPQLQVHPVLPLADSILILYSIGYT